MIAMNLGLAVLVFFLMRHVQNLLQSDIQINLNEIVTQNKSAITSRLMLTLNSLDTVSAKFTETLKDAGAKNMEGVQTILAVYAQRNNVDNLFVANRNGLAFMQDGRTVDISGRRYFRLALGGSPNISEKVISRITGQEIFVISVPLYYENAIVGTIQRLIPIQEMQELCSLPLFSSHGYMYIIDREGYTILHTEHMGCAQLSDNYFRDLHERGNQQAAARIRADIQNNRSGFTDTTIAGRKEFSAYTPIERIHDWYLITSVPRSAVAPHSSTVITLFYYILGVTVLIFTSSITYFLWNKNQQSLYLERLAFVDPVTQGNTYTKFVVDARETINKSDKTLHIVKFDIDNFKYINNFYGFDFGDQVLRQVYRTFDDNLHSGETLARMSGDHFVALFEDASENRIERILSTIGTSEAVLCFSVGVYPTAKKYEPINLMVDKAGTAAHTIKGILNKNIVYYSDAFEQNTIHNETLKRAVRQAITDKEFLAYYQPKVDILSGKLVGAEALVRWRTKDGKFIFPNEFIPMCEKTGLISDIDMIVYEKVLCFLRRNLKQGVPVHPVSVNFSRLHLLDDKFIDKVVSMRLEHDVPANLIELELTESTIFDNMEQIRDFTRKMHGHGFAIAMDDFGSGYSSLNMLKDIPIDTLKIDKEFLAETADNARRNIIFSSIAQMARKLDIKVVVEGVEFVENVELMRQCGCTIAQGYFFAKPMPEEEFEKSWVLRPDDSGETGGHA